MRLKSKCNGCHRKLEIEGESGAGSVLCPACGGTVRLPQTILEQGQILGDFKINRHIGSGSMGDVYLATQMSMERDVAVKILPPDIGEDQEAVGNFMAEVRTLAKLDHHNIVTAFQAGEADGLYFLAMTYVDGGSLEDKLEAKGPLSEAEALYICLRVAQALRYAWDRFQIIHRDIKPENIMMHTAQNEPKILDLGISKIIGDDSRIHSETGILAGTPHYMSPEQAEASDHIDFRADMYSLGCTLYRLVTGQVPFDGPDPMNVLMQHVNAPIPDPLAQNPGLHPLTAELITELMAKKAEDRFDDWTELIDTLKEVLAAVKSPDTEFDTNTRPLKRRRTKLAMEPMPESWAEDDGAAVAAPAPRKGGNLPLILLIGLSLLVLIGIVVIVIIEAVKRRLQDADPPEAPSPVLEVRALDTDQGKALPDGVESVTPLATGPGTGDLAAQVKAALAAQPTQLNDVNRQITTLESLLKQAEGTAYADDLRKRLDDLKIQRVLLGLEKDATALYKKGYSKRGSRLLKTYEGPYAEATQKQRLALIRKLSQKYGVQPRPKR